MEVILEIARKDAAYTSRETDRIKSVVDLYKHSGGVLFYISHIGMCSPIKEYGFLRRSGLKTSVDFTHFGLESGMVFEGTTGVKNVFVVSIPNKKGRKD